MIFANGFLRLSMTGCHVAGAAGRFGVSASSCNPLECLAAISGRKHWAGISWSGRIEAHAELIFSLVEEKPDMILAELQGRLAETQLRLAVERGMKASVGTIWTFLDRCGPDVQKKTAHAAERPDILKRREAWFEDQLDLDPSKLVFIDETGAATNMARLRGRAQERSYCVPASRQVTGKLLTLWPA